MRAHPFTDVSLDCEFSFIDSTENLEFYWEREDIIEEYDAEDREFYRFFRYYDFFQVFTKVVYQFYDNEEQLEDQNALYEGRVSVDQSEIAEGILTLQLQNVDFSDEALYKYKAVSPNGRGESTVKLIVEGKRTSQTNLLSGLLSAHKGELIFLTQITSLLVEYQFTLAKTVSLSKRCFICTSMNHSLI